MSPLKISLHLTIQPSANTMYKKGISFDDTCEGRNTLHLTMGHIPMIEFHKPGNLQKLTEN